jgi:two-component system cell cycle response regulator DivK
MTPQTSKPQNVKPVEILLVEDDPGEAQLFEEVFAQNGLEALLMIASGKLPDLIVVDLNIPYISGHGVIEQFHPNDIPVVAFTSSLNEADRKRALELGARDYVRKPSSLGAYADAVRGIVQKWAPR